MLRLFAMRRFAFAFGLVLCLCSPARAEAQAFAGKGFDAHLFRPAIDSKGFFAVNGTEVLPSQRFSLGLVLDYGHGMVRGATPLVRDAFTGTFHLDYGIADRAVVGLSLPAILMSGPGVDVQSFQHVAAQGKVRLTSANGPLGVAVAAQVGIPVSDASRSAGADPTAWLWPRVILEKRLGSEDRMRLALEAGWRMHSASSTTLPLRGGVFRDGSLVTYGAAASYRVLGSLDVVAETYASYLLSDSGARVKPSNEALAGVKVFVEDSSFLMIGAGPRYTDGFEAADFRATVGFVFEPRLFDRRGSGSTDRHEGGDIDTDDDGIPDVEDACPYVKGPRTTNPRTNGCPPLPEPPVIVPPDYDHDGIPDAEDACPKDFGKPHPDPRRHGCPDILFGTDEMIVFDKIMFETNSAKILPVSDPILDKVAYALQEHKELALIEIAGHADERGSEKLNLALTQARVESVMRALIARSVDRQRLRAKGYGYYCPIAEGHDESAWGQNRRVEFKIVKGKDGPTSAPLGCDVATEHGVRPDPIP